MPFNQAKSRKENRELKTKQKALNHHLNRNHTPFIADAPSMQPILRAIEQVSATDANVLILGENGTGKELVAHAIHDRSNRSEEPFIAVDLGAIPATLFESEMLATKKDPSPMQRKLESANLNSPIKEPFSLTKLQTFQLNCR